MKKLYIILIVLAAIIVVSGVAVGVVYGANHYLNKSDNGQPKLATCKQKGTSHTVTIQNDKANPSHTNGTLCDTLTIANNDHQILLIAFGPHEHHQPYDGVTEQELTEGQSLTITLNQAGTFDFHDHLRDIVQGNFTVTK